METVKVKCEKNIDFRTKTNCKENKKGWNYGKLSKLEKSLTWNREKERGIFTLINDLYFISNSIYIAFFKLS